MTLTLLKTELNSFKSASSAEKRNLQQGFGQQFADGYRKHPVGLWL